MTMKKDLNHTVPGLKRVFSEHPQAPAEYKDAHLVHASQHGDQTAFALLVQRYQRPVFHLILRMLCNYEDASDVTQETFFAAWQGLSSFRSEAQFSTWLSRIAYHASLRQLER